MRLAPLLAVLLLAGCLGIGGSDEEEPWYTPVSPTAPTRPAEPPLVLGGVILDARTNEPVADAFVRLDLAQTRPCGRQGLGWSSWSAPVADGTWGPLEVPRPRSDDVAFFLHVGAPGYTENATFIGPAQARGDIRNMTIVLHEAAAIEGDATPGTVVALDGPGFPRFTVADAEGRWRFDGARVLPAWLVMADAESPYRALVAAPTTIQDNATRAPGWRLEGTLRGPTGAPLAADVAAWNGTELWSAARAGDNGVFVLPLPAQPASMRIEARSADNQFGGVRMIEINGLPATRETIPMRALC